MLDEYALVDGFRSDDESGDALAEVVIGCADDSGFGHRRMGEQRVFHLAGSHLEPTRLDQVRGQPAEQSQPALSVIATEIARPEPAVLRVRRGCRVRSVEVAVEHRVAA